MSDGQAPAAPAPETVGGTTFLTQPPPPAEMPAEPAPGSADAALAQAKVENARPEWAPEKFWDADKKTLRQEELGKSYQNLEKLIGRDKVPLPQSADDEEGWERWYKASGRPEAPEKYEFKRPELPAEIGYDQEAEDSLRSWAYANGLNQRQAGNLYDGYVKLQIERHGAYVTSSKQQTEAATAALMREHGTQFEAFKRDATTAIDTYGDPDFRKFLAETGLGNDPRMIRFAGRVGKELGGETRIHGKATESISAADGERAISDFRSKNETALYDKGHADHARATKELTSLYEKVYGKEAANRIVRV